MAIRGEDIETVSEVGDLNLTDAQIISYRREDSILLVNFKDRQKESHQIRFETVASVEDCSCLNTNLRHMEISKPSGQPEGIGLKLYEFISAWDEIVLLQIKADSILYSESTSLHRKKG